MKRFVLIFALAIFTIMISAAGDEVKVVEGTARALKAPVTALVEFDWDGATWDNGISLEEQWGKDYAQICSESEATFIAQFNKKNKKGLQLSDSIEDSDVEVVVKITNADKHWNWGMATTIWGTITVKDKGRVVLKVRLNEVEGEGDNSADDSVARCFLEIANKFAKVK